MLNYQRDKSLDTLSPNVLGLELKTSSKPAENLPEMLTYIQAPFCLRIPFGNQTWQWKIYKYTINESFNGKLIHKMVDILTKCNV